MNDAQKREAAKKFAEKWLKEEGNEKSQTQTFWNELLRKVYGVEETGDVIKYEVPVKGENTNFIDGLIDSTHVIIEQKSAGIDLTKKAHQSDDLNMTPYQQAKRYSANLDYDRRPLWIVTCNFHEFRIHDQRQPSEKPTYIISLSNLEKDYKLMNFLINIKTAKQKRQEHISKAAGELVGRLKRALSKQYDDPKSPESVRSLNILCVRLVFCLYADDAKIFGESGMFREYLSSYPVREMHKALLELFRVLDMTQPERDAYDKYMSRANPELAAFPYVNGGLFSEENIDIPPFTEEIRDLLLNQVSAGWYWNEINPTIFGAVFESALESDERRSGGMHYTTVENIHKVIDPLFLDDLKAELAEIKAIPNKTKVTKEKSNKLLKFQKKLASLAFLDPACGSGNFLTETYLSLRALENEALDALELAPGQKNFDDLGSYKPIRVEISQFYGIEINDYAAAVARTALWIAESQMMQETESIVKAPLDFLPLKTNANIHVGNALKMDWGKIVPLEKLNGTDSDTDIKTYIISNPPFAGARLMGAEQKKDLNDVFSGWKNIGELDYVCCWYKKSLDLMKGTKTRAALVSTNSVCQGVGASALWKPLLKEEGAQIDFAHRTFRWDSQSDEKAHVHCVIIGFSVASKEEASDKPKDKSKNISNEKPKIIYDGRVVIEAENINAYLINADNIFIESRSHPLYDAPEIGIGNQPIDGGNYLFTEEERDEFLKKEPSAAEFFHPWYGSYEFINRRPRYCLWLGDCPPNELRKMPECMKRVQAVKDFRLASKRPGTVKLADVPTRFHWENMPQGYYIVIPEVSSERRRYIPIGFMTPDIFSSNLLKIIPDATLYHFGVLTSNVHMAWTRAVCGRLKSDYRYSNTVVYNNFPWPETISPEQREKIEKAAQAILDARAKYPDSSLADLYDELTMPPELRRAHRENDRAVMEAYGFSVSDMNEAACVAELMKLYADKTKSEKAE